MKRLVWPALVLFALPLCMTGCPTEPESPQEPEIPSSPRLEIIWAGPLGETDWATIAFKSAYNEAVLVYGEDGKPVVENGDFVRELVYRDPRAVIQFASETDPKITAGTEYAYDTKTGIGFMPKPARISPPVDYAAPGSFAIPPDERTIAFADFQGSGSPLTLYKLYPDAGKSFDTAAMPADLENTVWVGVGFRTEDWVTLSFRGTKGGMIVQVAHVSDSTQWSRSYTYDGDTKNGGIVSVGAFEIRDGNAILRIPNFYGHGASIDLQRAR
jgi:hypothetical protein